MRLKSLICAFATVGILQFTQIAMAAPKVHLDVRWLGAAGDGQTDDTGAFQATLDACAGAGGGEVLVPPGNYLVGSIQIGANTTLHLDKDATLTGSPNPDAYPLMSVRYEGEFVQGHRALIYAENVDNVAIVGPGILQGDMTIGRLRNPRAPVMVECINCKHIRLEDFSDRYRRMWSIHLLYCQDVTARNLNIRTTQSNGDGIDVDSSVDVTIDHCDIDTGDDCIAIKSGRGMEAVRLGKPAANVTITDCLFGSGFAGVAIGSEMSGGVRDVRVENCKFTHGANAIFIKARTGRGGEIADISASHLDAATQTFLGIDLRDRGIIGTQPVPGDEGIPGASHISISDATVNCGTLIDGSHILPRKPVDGLSISRVGGTCQRGILLANYVNVSLADVNVSGYSGPFLQTRDVSGNGLDGAVALPLSGGDEMAEFEQKFANPPDDTRPMVRWWWFGPAVTKTELEREMNAMKQGGFGGIEVQPTYPLALDGSIPGLVNLKFLSPEFLDMLHFVAATAKQIGFRFDLTMGSGWPYGGATIPIADAAGKLRLVRAQISGRSVIRVPAFQEPEELLGVFAGPPDNFAAMQPVEVRDNAAQLPPELANRAEVLFFFSSRTGMVDKRPAYGAEGFVVNHQDPAAVQQFIQTVAAKEVAACAPNTPYAIFCDSLESYGEDWTDKLLDEFQKRRGYDLRPLLPALVGDIGPKTLDIRYDWGKTLTELFNDYFARQMRSFASDNGTKFRAQFYGTPSSGEYSYADIDLPEGEGYQWHGFRESRYASSACHLLGVPVASAETLTWVHSPVFRATPLDIKAGADLFFLQGDNLLIFHGWPYTAEGVPFPGWSFYAAGVFDDKNPWWIVMPDLNKYLQRVSHILQQGSPANDVALYLSNSDAWASFSPGRVSLSDGVGRCLGPAIVGDILDAGYNLDFFDDGLLDLRGKMDRGALTFGGLRYRVAVLAGVERMPLSTLQKLQEFADNGGILVATRRLPSRVPGYLATDADQQAAKQIVQHLFQEPGAPGIFLQDESQLAEALSKRLRPDVRFSPPAPLIGVVHRHLDNGEIYFLANTSNQPQSVTATFRVEGMSADWLDPMTGRVTPARILAHPEGGVSLSLNLEPYASTILMISNRVSNASPRRATTSSSPMVVELNSGWNVQFGPDSTPMALTSLHSWTDDPATRNFSGVATYTDHFNVAEETLHQSARWSLSFGPSSAGPPIRLRQSYATSLIAPVREAAVVWVNGQRAGSAWCPPYTVDVTPFLKAGDNDLRIDVANTALNYLAAHGFPNYDYRRLTAKFGDRFDPQDVNQIVPISSGLMGPIQLMGSSN